MYESETLIKRWQIAMGVVWFLLTLELLAHAWDKPVPETIGQFLVMTALFALLMAGLEWLKRLPIATR
jgi:uncharacterized protein YhhL (DUF1145 family)